MSDGGRPGRGRRLLLGLTHGVGLIAVILVVLVGAAAFIVSEVLGPGTDPGKARAEVQRYYDARLPGRVDVDSCESAPTGSSDYESFSSIRVSCERRVLFSVPRAAGFGRSDFGPRPESPRALRLPCSTGR